MVLQKRQQHQHALFLLSLRFARWAHVIRSRGAPRRVPAQFMKCSGYFWNLTPAKPCDRQDKHPRGPPLQREQPSLTREERTMAAGLFSITGATAGFFATPSSANASIAAAGLFFAEASLHIAAAGLFFASASLHLPNAAASICLITSFGSTAFCGRMLVGPAGTMARTEPTGTMAGTMDTSDPAL